MSGSHNHSSAPTNEFSEETIRQRLHEDNIRFHDEFEPHQDSEAVPYQQDQSEETGSETTIAHSDSFVQDRVAAIVARRQKDQAEIQITELDTSDLDCRVLIRPSKLDAFAGAAGCVQVRLRRYPSYRDDDDTWVYCFAITQSQDDIHCNIMAPLACRLYYDSFQDSVEVVNQSSLPIHVIQLDQKQVSSDTQRLHIGPYAHRPASPGAWAFASLDGACAFQAIIFPRDYSLSIIRPGNDTLAGRKRSHSDTLDRTLCTTNSTLLKPINSLAETEDGDMVRMKVAETEEYRITRMRAAGYSRHFAVFQARVSKYPNEVVVVKVLKQDSTSNARFVDFYIYVTSVFRCSAFV